MIQPKIQEVYIAILVTEDNIPEEEVFTKGRWDGFGNVKKRDYNGNYSTHNENSGGLVTNTTHFLKPQQLITFTPEEFETFKREFGKDLLKKAADNAKLGYDRVLWDDPKEGEDAYMNITKVDKESILNTLDEYLLNNKI